MEVTLHLQKTMLSDNVDDFRDICRVQPLLDSLFQGGHEYISVQTGLGCGQCYLVSCVSGNNSKTFCKSGSSVLVSLVEPGNILVSRSLYFQNLTAPMSGASVFMPHSCYEPKSPRDHSHMSLNRRPSEDVYAPVISAFVNIHKDMASWIDFYRWCRWSPSTYAVIAPSMILLSAPQPLIRLSTRLIRRESWTVRSSSKFPACLLRFVSFKVSSKSSS